MATNGIKQWKSAPYHPSSNRLAEKAVQIVKQGLKRMKDGSVSDRLSRVPFTYRITTHTTTGVPPAQLLMGRNLKSRFDLLKLNLTTRVEQKQQQQKHNHDTHAVPRKFQEGEKCIYVILDQAIHGCQAKLSNVPVQYLTKCSLTMIK